MNTVEMLNTITSAMDNGDAEVLEGLTMRVMGDLLISRDEREAWVNIIDSAYSLVEQTTFND